jgi:hypothetical protein
MAQLGGGGNVDTLEGHKNSGMFATAGLCRPTQNMQSTIYSG